MNIFKLNVPKWLEQAILSNRDSKERWDRHVKKLEDGCEFLFTSYQDFTVKGNTKQKEEESTTYLPQSTITTKQSKKYTQQSTEDYN